MDFYLDLNNVGNCSLNKNAMPKDFKKMLDFLENFDN